VGSDGVLRRWSVPVPREVVTLRTSLRQVQASGGRISAVAMTEDANGDGVANLWRADPTRTGHRVGMRRLALGDVSEVVDADATVVLSRDGSGKARIVNAASPDRRFVATLRTSGRIDVDGLDPRRRIGSVRGADDFYGNGPDTLAIGPGGSLLASVGRDAAAIWDVATGNRLASIGGDARSVAFSHDGRRLLVTGIVTRILDAHTGDLVTTLQGQVAPTSAAFSPDDTLVVTAGFGRDHTVRLWDAADGTLIQTLHPPDDGLEGAIFDDRSAQIATWGEKFLRVYDCDVCGDLSALEHRADARITRKLTSAERRRYGL